MRQKLAATLAAGALVLALGCGDVEGDRYAARPDDSAVAAQVNERLRSEPGLAGSNLHARSENGSIVLTGTVPSAVERQRAEDLAGDVPGVGAVINQIEVAAAGIPPAVGAPPPPEPEVD